MDSTDAERERRWRAWMTAAQDGDAEAYERLLREMLPVVRGFVQRRIGDLPLAEDIVQNVLLSIHRARHTYRPERPFGPWWRAICRHAAVDAFRVRGRNRRETALDAEAAEVAAPPSGPVTRELPPALVEALAKLPANQREAVELLQLEGLSVAEAAQRAGVSQSALKVRAHRGYRALRDRLRSEET